MCLSMAGDRLLGILPFSRDAVCMPEFVLIQYVSLVSGWLFSGHILDQPLLILPD